MHKYTRILIASFILAIMLFINGCYKDNNIVKMSSAKNNDDILKLSLVTYDGKSETKHLISAYGHTFLVLENISSDTLKIGSDYYLKQGEKATLSWWAVDIHMGLWFNIEANYINLYNRYEQRYSIYQYLNSEELVEFNNYLRTEDKYTPLANCSKNCSNIWNLTADTNEKITDFFICSPSKVAKEIKQFNDWEYNIEIEQIENTGYFSNNKFSSYKMEIPKCEK